MSFDELSPSERHERARRIEFAMRDPITFIDFGNFTREDQQRPEVREQIRKRLMSPSRMTAFLHAASLVRRNQTQWTSYLRNPTRQSPKAFESFADDKVLVLYLFCCDILKLFRLNPRYPFLICEQVDIHIFHVNGKPDDDYEIVKSVVNMWISLGSPWKESKWGAELSSINDSLRETNTLKRKRRKISIGWNFWEMAREFGFQSFLHGVGTSLSTNKMALNMPYFVMGASIAVAFDYSGYNTFELIHELLPQFPEFIPNAIRAYFLSITSPERPDIEDATTLHEHERLLKMQGTFPTAETILGQIFDTEIWYIRIDENINLRNQSILEVIKKHPELFMRWTADSKIRKLHRRLIDPTMLYDFR